MRFATGFVLVISLLFTSFAAEPSESLFQSDPIGVDGGVLVGEVPRLDGYTIYFTEGSGEASRYDRTDFGMSRLAGLLQRLGAKLLTLDWNAAIPEDADMIIVAGPIVDLDKYQSSRLWAYINRGGRVLMFADPLRAGFDRNDILQYDLASALPSDDGFFALTWSDLGIRARDEIVVTGGDLREVQPIPDVPREDEPTPTPMPLVESLTLNTGITTSSLNLEHPVAANIEGELAFFGARPIEFDSSIQLFDTLVLVYSEEDTYGEGDYGRYLLRGVAQYNNGEDLAQGPQALAAVVEDDRTGTRLMVIGDRDFVTNGGGFRSSPPSSAGFIFPNNVRFILNSIVWLLDAESEDKVDFVFPTPGPTVTVTPTSTPTPFVTSVPEDNGE